MLCQTFANYYKDKLQKIAERPDGANEIAKAIERYDQITDWIGRIYSYAKLTYSYQRAVHYGSNFRCIFSNRTQQIGCLSRCGPDLASAAYSVAAMAAIPANGCAISAIPGTRKIVSGQDPDFPERLAEIVRSNDRVVRFTVVGQEQGFDATLELLQDPDENSRRDAYEAIAAGLAKNMDTFVLLTNMLAKDKAISDRWRKFPDPAASRHLSNHVEGQVVANLVGAVQDSYPGSPIATTRSGRMT